MVTFSPRQLAYHQVLRELWERWRREVLGELTTGSGRVVLTGRAKHPGKGKP